MSIDEKTSEEYAKELREKISELNLLISAAKSKGKLVLHFDLDIDVVGSGAPMLILTECFRKY